MAEKRDVTKGYVGIRFFACINPGSLDSVGGINGAIPDSASEAIKMRSLVVKGYTIAGRNSS